MSIKWIEFYKLEIPAKLLAYKKTLNTTQSLFLASNFDQINSAKALRKLQSKNSIIKYWVISYTQTTLLEHLNSI